MLSGVLNSKVAVEANRRIMRAFVAYRHLAELPIAATYLELKKPTNWASDWLRNVRKYSIKIYNSITCGLI